MAGSFHEAFEKPGALKGKVKRRPGEGQQKAKDEEKKASKAHERKPHRASREVLTVKDFEHIYLDLAAEVREMGIDPAHLPPKVWNPANEVLAKAKELREKYASATRDVEKKKITDSLQRLRISLEGGRIGKMVLEAAKELKEEKEKPFDPHSVPSILSVEEQQQAQKMREHLYRTGELSGEFIQEAGVDIDHARAPQYGYKTGPGMQEDMDALQHGPEQPDVAPLDTKNLDTDLSDPVPPVPQKTRMAEAVEQALIDRNIAARHATEEPTTPQPAPEEGAQQVSSDTGERETEIRAVIDRAVTARGKEEEAAVASPEGLMVASPEDAPEHIRATTAERTPKEWREKLRGLIEGAKDKLEWWKSSEEHLIRRSAELDAEAEKIGWIEKKFRSWGEGYNKMPFKYKVLIGASLGVGTVASAGTLAMALPLLGIAAQRITGLASMYLKYEKDSHEEKWGKNTGWGKQKAMLKAGTYTVLMGLTMKEVIELASETELAHAAQAKIEGWLGSMLGHSGAPEVPAPRVPEVAEQPAAAAAAGEAHPGFQAEVRAVDIATAPETVAVPPVEVEVQAGKGAEWMMKQFGEKGLDPSTYPEGSDIRRLLEADASSVDKIVHKIASEHGFYKADGSSVRIDLGSHMTVGADGQFRLNDALTAPESAPFTHPEVPAAPADSGITESAKPIGRDLSPDEYPEPEDGRPLTPQAPEASPAPEQPSGVQAEQAPAPVEERVVPSPEPASPTEGVKAPEAPATITNQFGVSIPTGEPHIYAGEDAAHTYVFGGTPVERANLILQYLKENPNRVVYGPDDAGEHRIPWHLVGGELVPGVPVRTGGFLGTGFFSGWMKPPGPEDLQKLIK